MKLRNAIVVVALLAIASCGAAGDEHLAQLRAAVSLDPSLFQFVWKFRVAALAVGTVGDQAVTCNDFPSRYTLESPELDGLIGNRTIEFDWGQQQQEIQVDKKLRVPVETPLLFVVEGLAPYTPPGASTPETFIVARGCTPEAGFEVTETTPTVSIDAVATVGAPCSSPTDCEMPQLAQCMSGLGFTAGYCTQQGCTPGSCVPGSVCVSDGGGSFCARRCPAAGDTASCPPGGTTVCQGRTSGEGCSLVCVPPQWNTASACTL